ncbi:hypothetical protein [Streptomyces orinoci]|uniref:Uncharacterized protein n=1 Tax=Streptomyces orinoci TaxID=67339 RepID=A0ABV3K7Q7_STRON|nr:hypothetical protein [Streptomyces orinoci]
MTRRLTPRHITLGGREAVALTVEEYEQLLATRRQIGGQSARVRALAHEAKRTEQLLQDLERLIRTPPNGRCEQFRTLTTACPPPSHGGAAAGPDAGADCLRCAIAALLRRHRDPAPDDKAVGAHPAGSPSGARWALPCSWISGGGIPAVACR